MRWIRNHKLICFLISVIVICAVIVISSVATMGNGNPVSKAINSICVTILKPVNVITDKVGGTISQIVNLKEISAENEALKEENEQLRAQLAETTLNRHELAELKNLSDALNYKGIGDSKGMVTGDIISMDDSRWMNNFTIGIGSEEGVKEGDIVVSGKGLVGTVSLVSEHWAKVRALIDENSKVSIKIAGNMQLIGIVDSFANGEMSGFMLDSKAKVVKGDKIITSGMGIYPAGLEVGQITKVKYDSDAQLQRITVKSTVDFSSLQKVTVII